MSAQKRLFPISIACMLLLSLIQPATAANILQAKDIPRITPADAQQLQNQEDITYIDTRKPDQWQTATDKIPGAIRVTTYSELYALKKVLPADRAIITYCT